MPSLQACASVGQCILSAVYDEEFRAAGLLTSLVLLTRHDTARRSSYLHARDALTRLVDLGVVPVVNENDTTTVDEIKFGDNDTLAALVSCLVSADLCVTLSDIDGLLHGQPVDRSVRSVHPARRQDRRRDHRRGGRLDHRGGHRRHDHQDPREPHPHDRRHLERDLQRRRARPLVRLARGESVGTLFDPAAGRPEIAPRKLWIALGDCRARLGDGRRRRRRGRARARELAASRRHHLRRGGASAPATFSTCATRAASSSPAASPRPARDELELARGGRQEEIAGNRLLAALEGKPAVHRDNLVVFA